MTPLATAFGLAALNGFVLAGLIAGVRVNRVANRLLAALVAAVSLRPCIYVVGFAGLYDAHPWLTFLPLDLSAAFGPLIYLYVMTLTAPPPAGRAAHFIPVAVQFAYQLTCFLLPMPAKWQWYAGVHLDRVEPIALAAILIQGAAYVAAAWRQHARYQAWLDDRYADREQWRLGWLSAMLAVFGIALAVTIAAAIWSLVAGRLDYAGRIPAMLGFAVLAYLLGLLGYRNGATRYPVMVPDGEHDAEVEMATAAGGRSARTDYSALVEQWRQRTAVAGWWREERLSAAGLARHLHVSERTLSRGLREGGAGNFNLFVNTFRVRAVQRAIATGSRGDLLGLALENGFASKASFNRAFLAVTGSTPSAWRRTAQISPIDATHVI